MEESKKKILMLGNLPASDKRSIGGANTYTEAILLNLRKNMQLDVKFIQIRKNWYPFGQLFDFALLPFYFFKHFYKHHTISIHATWDFHVTIGPFIVLISKIFKKKVVYHFFGGEFHKRYDSFPLIMQRWLDFTILSSDYKLMETKRMINYFKSRGNDNFIWFPNSRSMPSEGVGRTKLFQKKFVFISRVTRTKGIDFIIAAADLLPKDYTIDIYGPLDDNIYGLDTFQNTGVNYKGLITPDEVVKTLSNYNVLILPTFHEGEGYPGIIIEAMSMGLPVITTNWNSMDELVNDKVNGRLISVKSSIELKEAIEFFNERNYAYLSSNSFASFNNFNISEVLKKLIQLY